MYMNMIQTVQLVKIKLIVCKLSSLLKYYLYNMHYIKRNYLLFHFTIKTQRLNGKEKMLYKGLPVMKNRMDEQYNNNHMLFCAAL